MRKILNISSACGTEPMVIDQGTTIELTVLYTTGRVLGCRVPGTENEVTLRPRNYMNRVPGETITVKTGKSWRYSRHSYLSGDIISSKIDIPSLGLLPLKLYEHGTWNPEDEYWGEPDEPVDEWAESIISYGPRPCFEMEQILPESDPDDFDDAIRRSNDFKEAGDYKNALKILMSLCHEDVRCLDAHAHLGNFCFDNDVEKAISHYEVGMRIGELSLGSDFRGTLLWGLIDNRPFLRCLHGYGLCLWRSGRFKEAEQVFQRMLWLNPPDNQGIRFLLNDVQSGLEWNEDM